MITQAAASGVGLGLAAHLLAQVFEPPFVPTIRLHVFSFVGLTAWLWKGKGLKLLHSLATAMTLSTTYVLALASSIAVYRLFLHRLRRYPGETIHKLTMMSWMQIDRQGKRPARIRAMHAKYGPIVRIGPRELSIADVSAAAVIYGSDRARCTKGPWYASQSASPASTSLQSETSPSKYAARRNQWDAALSSSLVQDWSTSASSVVELLMSRLDTASEGEAAIDIAGYFVRFSLDCESLLATGTSLNLMEETKVPPMIDGLNEGIRLLDTIGHVPYLLEAVRLIPSSTREFDRWVASAVQSRLLEEKGRAGKTTLVEILQEGNRSHQQIAADASLFITHGSNAMQGTLTECVRQLVERPRLSQRLAQEIHDVFGTDKADDLTRLHDECPFLNACISEALRLYPPVPNGPQRVTPSQGLRLPDNTHLPGNVIVSVPTYTLHRDPSNFSSPDDFDPTRWLPSESKAANHHMSAYAPFGYASSCCVGKELALMQCRLILAGLFHSFALTPADSINGDDIEGDHIYTLATTPCLINLETR